ncbi:MAG: type 1 glutamine amidotransferase, partial [Gaiellaceae bacterium]
MKDRIRLCHLYPDQLNIYADRGNIAVLRSRAERRGYELELIGVGVDEALAPDCDLIYLGGGQDREQALIAPDLARRSEEISSALEDGAALLAVCGGYQLLGRGYRDRTGVEMPGAGVLPLETVAGDRRMIGDVSIECELDPGEMLTVVGFENHGGRTLLDPGAVPLGRVVHGFGNDGGSGFEGCR